MSSMIGADYLHLHPTGINPCTREQAMYEEAVQTWLCTGSGAPKSSVGALNVQIQEQRPADEPITFIMGCGVVLARRDFLEQLGAARVQGGLMLGHVSGPTGIVNSDWVSVRGRQKVIIRGSRHVSYRRCDSCGRHVYSALGPRYLFPAPENAVSIYESDLYGLLIEVNALESIALSKWPKLGIERLKSLPKPKDSLGELR